MTIYAPDTPALDPAAANELLADIGFLHVPGRPHARPPAYLLVALRPAPTLQHFDAERIDYWSTVEGAGTRAWLDRSLSVAPEGRYGWGAIDVVDRKSISNQFVSFGGLLRVKRFGVTRVCVFSSEAPIAARGGHSQSWDPLASEMVAFVGRLRALVARDRALEHSVNGRDPLSIYSAFVADAIARQTDRHGVLIADEAGFEVLCRERRELHDEHEPEWRGGLAIAAMLA